MKLADIGEFGLIHRIAPQFLENVRENVHGIGDDCAVIPQDNDESLLVTTDMLVEDVHFLRHKISAFDLGHKSLAVNLSDIAAMGGTPTAAFLSLALPKDISVEWLDDFCPDILGVQEIKAKKDHIPNSPLASNYHLFSNPAERKGYSGVAVWSKTKRPDRRGRKQ